MSFKKSTSNLKNFIDPNKNENLIIFLWIIISIFIYYDALIEFPRSNSLIQFLFFLLFLYVLFFILFYIYERKRIIKIDFQNTFFFFFQIIFTLFTGIILCLVYILINANETIVFVICVIPMIFLITIITIQKIYLVKVEKFLKWMMKDEIWKKIDEQTKRDFKQAESSIRMDNIPNAIINICKGIERELKLAIFQPFKEEVVKNIKNFDYFKILEPFKEDGSDPRYRTYLNFKNYLEGKRHLTFGNIPFFLLNLTDKKIGKHTILFSRFEKFLQDRFKERYKNVIEISKILFNHDYFTIKGIKISDLRNEAAHPQKYKNNKDLYNKSEAILSIDNYFTLLKVMVLKPNLLKLIVNLKK